MPSIEESTHDLSRIKVEDIKTNQFLDLKHKFKKNQLINPICTMLIQLNWLSLPRPFQEKHPYALP